MSDIKNEEIKKELTDEDLNEKELFNKYENIKKQIYKDLKEEYLKSDLYKLLDEKDKKGEIRYIFLPDNEFDKHDFSENRRISNYCFGKEFELTYIKKNDGTEKVHYSKEKIDEFRSYLKTLHNKAIELYNQKYYIPFFINKDMQEEKIPFFLYNNSGNTCELRRVDSKRKSLDFSKMSCIHILYTIPYSLDVNLKTNINT